MAESGGRHYQIPTAVFVILLVIISIIPVSSAYVGMENSKPCTCNDLADMQSMRNEVGDLYGAFNSVLTLFYTSLNPPKNFEDASRLASDIAFGKAIIPDWLLPMIGGGSGSGSTPVAGLRDGQPWIDPVFAAKHCQQVLQSYIEHELEHIKYLNELEQLSWWTKFTNAWDGIFDPQWFAKQKISMELNAYAAQWQYLNHAIETMEKECEDREKCDGDRVRSPPVDKKGFGQMSQEMRDSSCLEKPEIKESTACPRTFCPCPEPVNYSSETECAVKCPSGLRCFSVQCTAPPDSAACANR